MRWLLLDEVISIKKNVKASTRSRIPQEQVSPEFLMLEMMAQTGALLLGAENNYSEDLIFAKVESAVYEPPYHPGESIFIHVTSENLRPEGAWLEGQIEIGDRVIARSRFLLMNVGRLIPGQKKPITFHDNFMNYFNVHAKVQN